MVKVSTPSRASERPERPERILSRLSPTPDLTSPGRMMVLAAAIAVLIACLFWRKAGLAQSYGDTDDAMRLVLVRDLLAGRGWYDQLVTRLQPPQGLYLHWSRLLDGGLAGAIALARTVLPPDKAELLARGLWPPAWIAPSAFAVLWLARRLGGAGAVVVTATLLAVNLNLYAQFGPGRIDHHNVQIAMALLALGGAVAARDTARGAAIAGLATGLGLAIGLEAAAFEAMIGAWFMARLAFDPGRARPTAAYGASLALTALAAFLIQTPPWRWSLSVCDALALNSVAALIAAGGGLALAAALAGRLSTGARIALLGLVAGLSLGLYLGLHPACLAGPFAGVDPGVRTLWLNRVQEVQPLWVLFRLSRTNAIAASLYLAAVLAAGAWLVRRRLRAEARPSGWELGLILGLALAAGVMGVKVWRMCAYAFWFGAPVLGAALASLGPRGGRPFAERFLPAVALGVVASPGIAAAALIGLIDRLDPPSHTPEAPQAAARACFDPAAYRRLASLPPGEVLAEPDVGPFILLFTRDSVLSAPYHRMGPAIVRAHLALDAPPGVAAERVRALHARYIVTCLGMPPLGASPGLDARLRGGRIPDWLAPLSAPGERLKIYRVEGAGARDEIRPD